MSQDAVIHSLSVAVGRTRAFEIWVSHIDLWWPKSGHTRSGDPVTTVCLECAAGGRFFERTSDGREINWGTIEAWEPPNRIAFTWWMGADAETATKVEVTFAEGGPGLTEVVVRHSAGRMAAADWADLRDDFRRGFAAVIRAYDDAVRTEGGIP